MSTVKVPVDKQALLDLRVLWMLGQPDDVIVSQVRTLFDGQDGDLHVIRKVEEPEEVYNILNLRRAFEAMLERWNDDEGFREEASTRTGALIHEFKHRHPQITMNVEKQQLIRDAVAFTMLVDTILLGDLDIEGVLEPTTREAIAEMEGTGDLL